MLKVFDKNHNAIGHIVKYKDLKIESEVATGSKSLSFTYLAKTHKISTEYYIQTKTDEYVIREESLSSDGFPQYVATLNLEELEGKAWQTFSVTDATIDEAAGPALAGTGWTVGESTVTKRRNAAMIRVSSKGAIEKLCTGFMCEPVYDTINKKVSFYEAVGEDKGNYFISGLNLKKLSKKSDTYDYYTQIIPIGEDGLTIEGVNDGKNYLENYQYSGKVKVYIWVDESYTNAAALKEDAEKKLDDLSKPIVSYSCDVRDLARQKAEYSILSYKIGDKVWLIDRSTGTREKQRIVKLTEYPQSPDKNTCELANTVLTFEEMQQKLQAAADIVNATISDDGKIRLSDILHWEDGIAGSSAVTGLRGSITDMQGDLAEVKLTLGELDVNYLKADEADLKYATIERADIIEASVHSIEGDYASFKSTITDELSAQTARIDALDAERITTEYLEANFADVNLSNIVQGSIQTYMLGNGVVGSAQIADASITDAKIVELTANKITAGTLSVERLEIRGSENSLVYALNNITGALQAQNVNTLNGEILTPRTITADKVVANAITSTEINTEELAANQAFLTEIFAQDITATGTITGVHIVGATGDFTGTVNATAGVFRGSVYASSGEFTGTVNATALSVSQALTGAYRMILEADTKGIDLGVGITGADVSYGTYKAGYMHIPLAESDKYYITHGGDIWIGTSGSNSQVYICAPSSAGSKAGILLSAPNSSIQLDGETILTAPLTVSGKVTATDQLSVSGKLYALGDLSVTGTTFMEDNVTVAGDISVTGSLSVSGNLSASGTASKLPSHFYHYLYSDNHVYEHFYPSGGNGSSHTYADLRVWDGSGKTFKTFKIGGDGSVSWPGQMTLAASGNALSLTASNAYLNFGTNGAMVYGQSNDGNVFFRYKTSSTATSYSYTNVLQIINSLGSKVPLSGNSTISGSLTISGNVSISGALTFPAYDGSKYRPIGSAGSSGNYIGKMGSHSTYVAVTAQWGATSFSVKNVTVSSSDVRLKTNIQDTNITAMDTINAMPVRQFDWKEGGHWYIGMVADELEILDKNLAVGGGYTEDGALNVKSVDTWYLMGYVVKGMQELSLLSTSTIARIDTAEARIEALQAQLSEAYTRIAQLEQQLQAAA